MRHDSEPRLGTRHEKADDPQHQPEPMPVAIEALDDASRVVCNGEFFVSDNTEALLNLSAPRSASRGLCECLYVDHGSNCSSLNMSLRVGSYILSGSTWVGSRLATTRWEIGRIRGALSQAAFARLLEA